MDFTFEERLSDSPFIEKVWRTESERPGSFISHAVSHWEMVVSHYQGTTSLTVRGPETVVSVADCPAGAEFMGITFKLGTFLPHLAAEQLVNGTIVLPEATCRSFWLHGSTWQFPTFEHVDTFVERLGRAELLVRDDIVDTVLQGQPHDLSPRAVQYRFLRATGLTQTAIRQIERVRKAADLLAHGTSIADVVYEAGYFDQPHLTRSLKRFMGQTPAQIAQIESKA